MSETQDVVVLSAVRTATGKYGGSLKDKPPADLATLVTKEAVTRAGIARGRVNAGIPVEVNCRR